MLGRAYSSPGRRERGTVRPIGRVPLDGSTLRRLQRCLHPFLHLIAAQAFNSIVLSKREENRAAFEISAGVNSGYAMDKMDRFLRRLGFRQTGGNYSLVILESAAHKHEALRTNGVGDEK